MCNPFFSFFSFGFNLAPFTHIFWQPKAGHIITCDLTTVKGFLIWLEGGHSFSAQGRIIIVFWLVSKSQNSSKLSVSQTTFWVLDFEILMNDSHSLRTPTSHPFLPFPLQPPTPYSPRLPLPCSPPPHLNQGELKSFFDLQMWLCTSLSWQLWFNTSHGGIAYRTCAGCRYSYQGT